MEILKTALGLKVTVTATMAASFGGVLWVFAAVYLLAEVHMTSSISSVWCGAALLWRPGGMLPRTRDSVYVAANHRPRATPEVRFLRSTPFWGWPVGPRRPSSPESSRHFAMGNVGALY